MELIRGGAPCYLVVCEAVDVNAAKRRVKSPDYDYVIRGGRVEERDGNLGVELTYPKIPARDVMFKPDVA